MLAPRWPTPLAALRSAARPSPSSPSPTSLLRLSPSPSPAFSRPSLPSYTRTLCTTTPTHTAPARSFLTSYRALLAVGLTTSAVAFSTLSSSALDCASDRSAYAASQPPTLADSTAGAGGAGAPKEAESILSWRDLSFGTVSGICVGVFVKKGLRMAAFVLGGAFVFLQYLSSRSLISVNWSALSSSYDSFLTKRAGPPAAQGGNRIKGVLGWFIDFVAANVQQRATFVAGIALGFRLG
ncbi:hypothetical protein JCM8097_001496 [Rhodosporidiobolus ruineniae]